MTLKQAHKDALQALLTPEHMPSLFTVTHGRLPNFVAEAQCGGAKDKDWNRAALLTMVELMCEVYVPKADLKAAPGVPRVCKKQATKYDMEPNRGVGRDQNKEDSVRTCRGIMDRYDALDVLKWFDDYHDSVVEAKQKRNATVPVKQRKYPTKLDRIAEHDLCDAMLMALQDAENQMLSADHVPGTSAISFAIDPGYNNLALCGLELLELRPSTGPPRMRADGTEGIRAPDLIFRILDWRLIDLDGETGRDIPFGIKAWLPPESCAARMREPCNKRIGDYFTARSAKVERDDDKRVQRNTKAREARKRLREGKQPDLVPIDGDTEEPPAKRARVLIDLVDEAEMDLSE